MSDTMFLSLTPRDPLIARDGRPFVAGLRMKSLNWFYPSVVAGSLRTMLGNAVGGFPVSDNVKYEQLIDSLKQLAVAGPLPMIGKELYLPFPRDVEVQRGDSEVFYAYPVRPAELSKLCPGAGCNLPSGLEPAVLPQLDSAFKPESHKPAFISSSHMTNWLLDANGEGFLVGGASDWPSGFLMSPAKDRRMHVAMDYGTGAVKQTDGLFQTVGLDLNLSQVASDGANQPMKLGVRLNHTSTFQQPLSQLSSLGPLGGERRLVHWQSTPASMASWDCPNTIKDALGQLDAAPRKFVRLVLATPAIFGNGWRSSDWNETTVNSKRQLIGKIPGTEVEVRIISACIERWRAISGWGYEQGRVGPKPVRRIVPAGSVYFMEVTKGLPSSLANHWLQPISDDEQDRRDGFGLALWGVWSPTDKSHTFQ